jgi:RimJ/RimL family protein N-acetyltransferase
MLNLTITTKRLILRHPRPGDAPALQILASAWDVAKMTGSLPHPYPENGAADWIAAQIEQHANDGAEWAFAIECEGECVGVAGLKRESWIAQGERDDLYEIGYWLGVPFWGRGLMTEAVKAILDHAFGPLEQTCIVAGYFADNHASARVLEKLGFRETGRGQHHCVSRREDVDCVFVALSRDDWCGKTV